MSQVIDPIEDKSFADELRKLDRPVAVDAVALTNRVMVNRRRKRASRIAVGITIPFGLALVVVAINWMVNAPTSSPVPESVVQIAETNPGEISVLAEDAPIESQAQMMLDLELLSAQRAKLREAQRELVLLKQIKSRQDWMLSRELVSRTEINRTISAYEF